MAHKTLGETFAAVMTAATALLAVGCGWEGEPVIDGGEGEGTDTVYNDLTYTAVTGNVSSVSAIGADLKGFINTAEGFKEATTEIGFLLSRFKANPSCDDARQDSTGRNHVRLIKVYDVASDNSIETRVTGLIPYTKFYFRTYAVLKNGETVYGIAKGFMTQNLTLTLTDPPRRIGLFDADLSVKMGGISSADYGTTANLRFRCADAKMTSPTAPIAEEHSYDETTSASPSADGLSLTTTVKGLTPGRKYYAIAYMDIKSDFYDAKTDNPKKEDGTYTYGIEASDVETDKYHSQTIEITSTALTGVRSFTGEQATVDYDAVTIDGNYFTLPSDTLTADSYGVLISILPTVPADSSKRCESQADLKTGNRYSVFANNLSLNTQYFYKAYVEIRGVTISSQTIGKFATKDYAPKAIDLGLSVLWADRNVGAYAQELAGAYFAWGETSQKDEYTDETFVGAGVSVNEIGGTAYDVATNRWGAGWRMPTREEVNELFDKCDWKWTEKNGVAGYEITAPSENRIFIPASGLKLRGKVEDCGLMGYYWTSERGTGGNALGQVYDMYFRQGMKTDESKRPIHTCTPAVGLCVRAVFDGEK